LQILALKSAAQHAFWQRNSNFLFQTGLNPDYGHPDAVAPLRHLGRFNLKAL
jgi:hypothetical protein